MINTLFGIKKQMTATYDSRGRRVGATVVEIAPNLVAQVKKAEGKDGYNAIQIGVGFKKSIKKPQLGVLKKVGSDQKVRWFREVKLDSSPLLGVGKTIFVAEMFFPGDMVKVTGISKGKGFAGGVKRHKFAGGPRTHGQSDRHRAPGSIGAGTTPGRVLKGKKMAGHMGVETVTVSGLEVIEVDSKNNLLILKGGIPGASGSLVKITKTGKIKGYTPPPEPKEDDGEESKELSKEQKEKEVQEEQKDA